MISDMYVDDDVDENDVECECAHNVDENENNPDAFYVSVYDSPAMAC